MLRDAAWSGFEISFLCELKHWSERMAVRDRSQAEDSLGK